MLRSSILAAATILLAAPAFGQAAPLDIELEGVIETYDHATRTMVVMGNQVYIPDTAELHSPTTSRSDTSLTLNTWIRGLVFPGWRRTGFFDGTAIVIGTWDPVAGRIVASDITMEPSENVNLGVVTASFCTTPNCDGPGNYIRGNSRVGGSPGAAFLPLRDIRLFAGPVRDETLFPLNLTGVNLNGMAFAAEGYYGMLPVTVPNSTGGTVSEKAFHYFIWDLVNPMPHLFLNKDSREISVLRTRCNVGDRWEIRGYVHTTVNAAGVDNDSINSNSGVLSVQYRNPAGQLVRINGGAATTIPGSEAIGQFRIRLDTPFCPESYDIRWLPTAASPNTAAYASLTNVGIDRLREANPAD